MRNKVLIYRDYGCSDINNLYDGLVSYFENTKIDVGFVDASEIIKEDALNEDVLAFFLPGGASTPFRMKLKTQGDAKIKEYVENGGVYFGICAGAYYACSSINFENGIPELHIKTDEALKFINAEAVGTLRKQLNIAPYSKSADSARAVSIKWMEDDESHVCYYHGGPYFNVEGNNAKVLAVYEGIENNALPAVVSSQYGKGMVIASGVHFEDTGKQLGKAVHLLRRDYGQARKNALVLEKNEESRKALFNKLMSSIGCIKYR
ncbi:MAG: hypothetical protein LBR70_01675 [Lactobacillaceae bacterium]|jgi:glutamine amidotransferase-like uncharacterized protein|nr:hypothetical protein [Lactobacillaceae bacterium]